MVLFRVTVDRFDMDQQEDIIQTVQSTDEPQKSPLILEPSTADSTSTDTSVSADVLAAKNAELSSGPAQTDTERPILYSTEHFKIRIGNIHPRCAHSVSIRGRGLFWRKPYSLALYGINPKTTTPLFILETISWCHNDL